MANIIGNHAIQNAKDLSKILIKIKCPIIAIGIGAQVHFEDIKNKKVILDKNIIEFLNILSKKCNNIFIRCENTKKILNYFNINNVIVNGCPSVLLNSNKNLGNIIEYKINLLKNNNDLIKLNLIINYMVKHLII